jgi:hypothetical protein
MAWDFQQALDLLHAFPRCVAAVLCGHDHAGGYGEDEHGVHHVTFPSPLNCGASAECHAVVEVFDDRLVIGGRGICPKKELPLR